MFSHGEVDFCFIDASHVEEDVVRDIDEWWPKVKEGGVLAGHDYTWGSVKNATGAFVKAHGLKLVVSGNCWKITK
jgi:predicted O-methyltransferase YrrM